MLKGESGVARITLFDCSNFATQIAAEVKNWDIDEIGEWEFPVYCTGTTPGGPYKEGPG